MSWRNSTVVRLASVLGVRELLRLAWRTVKPIIQRKLREVLVELINQPFERPSPRVSPPEPSTDMDRRNDPPHLRGD
jgi:hypothetical protein